MTRIIFIYISILISIFFDIIAELLRYIKTSKCRVVIEQNTDDDNNIDISLDRRKKKENIIELLEGGTSKKKEKIEKI